MKRVIVVLLLCSTAVWAQETVKEEKKTLKPAAGMVVQLDESRSFGQDELDPEIRAALARLVNQSSEGLVEVKRPDGTVIVDLKGRFQSATVVSIGPDGKLVTRCVSAQEHAGCNQHKGEKKDQ